jgi:hypothetical protein
MPSLGFKVRFLFLFFGFFILGLRFWPCFYALGLGFLGLSFRVSGLMFIAYG